MSKEQFTAGAHDGRGRMAGGDGVEARGGEPSRHHDVSAHVGGVNSAQASAAARFTAINNCRLRFNVIARCRLS